ncbi:MAG TPA: hypothetical protein VMM12_12995 [Longimicrobiales bacterium]|nr:hypothetical protein [Longimicrobiales bacterium]
MSGPGDREARARAILAEEGVAARVRAVGADGEIAAVAAPAASLEAVRRLAPRLRTLGYRYVALDLVDGGHQTGE